MKQAENGKSVILGVNSLEVIPVLRELGAMITFNESTTVGSIDGFKVVHCPVWTGANEVIVSKNR